MSSVRSCNPTTTGIVLRTDQAMLNPPAVGVYRLFTDEKLRPAVWAKVKHATLRGLVVAGVYVAATYPLQRWFVENFLMGGFSLFGKRAQPPPTEVLETSLSWLQKADVVDCEWCWRPRAPLYRC
jgi:hypothetical protein